MAAKREQWSLSFAKEQQSRMDRRGRFQILHRDRFACRYCGARPGADLLEVDHLVPRSMGGLDRRENLVAACRTCNSRKSDAIIFPHDLIERSDGDQWFVHKTFGCWSVVFSDKCIGIDNDFGYGFIDSDSWPDRYWWDGLVDKRWALEVVRDLYRAASHLSFLKNIPDIGGDFLHVLHSEDAEVAKYLKGKRDARATAQSLKKVSQITPAEEARFLQSLWIVREQHRQKGR